MTNDKAEEREAVENALLPIVGRLPFLERGKTLAPNMYPELVDFVIGVAQGAAREASQALLDRIEAAVLARSAIYVPHDDMELMVLQAVETTHDEWRTAIQKERERNV
jgi:hypothetical protein